VSFVEDLQSFTWRDADRALRRLVRDRAALEVDEARWLVIAKRTGVHRELGYRSMVEYLERALGYAERTAYERLRVAEQLDDLPLVLDALGDRRLSYSAAREVSRGATRDTEAAWLAAVVGCSLRQIEARVAGRVRGDLPDDPIDSPVPRRNLPLRLSPQVFALFTETRRRLEAIAGQTLSDSDVIAALCEQGAQVVGATPTVATDSEPDEAATPTPVETTSTQVEPPAPDDASPGSSPWFVELVGSIVLTRDQRRCRVPGCQDRRQLQLHAIDDDGGPPALDPARLVTICGTHHRAIERGTLRLHGNAHVLLVVESEDERASPTWAMRTPRSTPQLLRVRTRRRPATGGAASSA
jgi:hypothetical protein